MNPNELSEWLMRELPPHLGTRAANVLVFNRDSSGNPKSGNRPLSTVNEMCSKTRAQLRSYMNMGVGTLDAIDVRLALIGRRLGDCVTYPEQPAMDAARPAGAALKPANLETIRDQFAMAALSGYLASTSGTDCTPGEIMADCYRMADAAMEARSK